MSQLTRAKAKPISNRAFQLITQTFQTRSISTDELEINYLYDKESEKSATVISNPAVPNTWVYECYGKDSETPLIMILRKSVKIHLSSKMKLVRYCGLSLTIPNQTRCGHMNRKCRAVRDPNKTNFCAALHLPQHVF